MDLDQFKTLLIAPSASIKEAMVVLNETGREILFVQEPDGRLVGTVTDGDIRRGLLGGSHFHEAVRLVMCEDFISLSVSETVLSGEMKHLIEERSIGLIPVLDEGGRVVRIISTADIMHVSGAKQVKQYSNPVVIMAGGKGTRMDPFTRILPKPLVPIGEKPIVQHIMDKFVQQGFSNFIYTLNYKKEYIKLFLQELQGEYSIDWIEEPTFLDSAGSLSLLREKLIEPFFVINCDSLFDVNFEDILSWHRAEEAVMTIVGCHKEVHVPFGVLKCEGGSLQSIEEKPVHDVTINTGLYVMHPRVFDHLDHMEPVPMNVLIDRVMEEHKVTMYPIKEGWLDAGQWKEYQDTVKQLNRISRGE